MTKSIGSLGLLAALAVTTITAATPATAANGCGPNRYRGLDGTCHRFGNGFYPSGYNGPNRTYGRNTPSYGAPSVSQSVNQSVSQTISQIVNQSVNQSIGQSVPAD